MGKIIRWCMFLAALIFASGIVTKSWADFYPGTDNIYKDFTRVSTGWYGGTAICGNPYTAHDTTSSDPCAGYGGCTLTSCGGNSAVTATVNSVDTTGATKAEVYISYWGGHDGTQDQKFRVNSTSDNDWKPLPLPTTPTSGSYYFRTLYNTVPTVVPLSGAGSLIAGNNNISFTAGSQGGGMPFFWVYSVTIRVYYSSSKTHPTGSITSPTSGSALGDSQTFTANVPTYTGGIRQVDFIGWYKDFNWEGDGRFQNWHHTYKDGVLDKHIGTDTTSPYSATWDTRWIPDQDQPMKVVARIVGNDGMCYITDAVDNLTFSRTSYSVKLYASNNVPPGFCAASFTSNPRTCSYTINEQLTNATGAKLMIATWCGAGQESLVPCAAASIREFGINNVRIVDAGGQLAGPIGAVVAPAFNTYDFNPNLLHTGTNDFYMSCNTQHHALEVNWPGPVLLVKYTTQGIPTASITAPSNNASFDSPANITINATATDSDGTISKVEFYNGSTKLGEDTSSPYNYTWSNVAAGSYVISVKSTDNLGNIGVSNLVSITVTGGSTVGNWWNDSWNYRVGLDIQAGAYERKNKPVEKDINFTTLITGLGGSGAFDPGSIRVVEVLGDGTVVNASVPFQFDQSSTYNATTNAAGTLVFIMDNTTVANATRYYHIYFNTGTNLTVPSVTAHVALTNSTDEGKDCYKIVTDQGTYYYQKAGAGFSSLVDSAGNDWINYHSAPTAGNEGDIYRGIPNMIHGDALPGFHPNATNGTTDLVSSGPIKAKIHSVVGGGWECYWEIYPEYAKMTLTSVGHNYWFLYEGTPGGTLDPSTDACVRPGGANGVETPLSATGIWAGDITPEWAYFKDGSLNRSIFFAHSEDDSQPESYWPILHDVVKSDLTVFGFGRNYIAGNDAVNVTKYMSAVPAHFTMGLYNDKTYPVMSKVIESSYRDLGVVQRTAEKKDSVSSAVPIKLHPDNPRYFLYKGQPTVLIGSNEHYGAVLNLDFNTTTYLDTLQANGLNYTRIFTGVYVEPSYTMCNPPWWIIDENTLGPKSDKLSCPFARSTTPGFYDDTPSAVSPKHPSNKFDLTKWDDNYFARLKGFVKMAGDRGIVVEVTFFTPYWNTNDNPGQVMWIRSPFKASNNINGVGNTASWTTSGLNSVWDINGNDGLRPYQEAMVTKIVQELNTYDNVIYQPSIEPNYNGTETNQVMSVTFDNDIISKIVAADTPKKHLISQNAVGDNNGSDTPLANVDILSWDFYSEDPSDVRVSAYNGYPKPIANDEITYHKQDDAWYRRTGWRWIIYGGALYNYLDLSFTTTKADGSWNLIPPTACGTQSIGSGNPALRKCYHILRDFIHSVNFIKMTRDVSRGINAWGLVGDSTNKQYAFYLTGPTSVTVNLLAGDYKAEWIDTKSMTADNQLLVVKTETIASHPGGNKTLNAPSYSGDIALRILDTAVHVPPVVSISTIGVINGSNAPATLTIDVNASSSDGIKQVDFYNGGNWLGTDSSSPYEYIWNNVPAGSYSITAKATDNSSGNTTAMSASQIVTITGGSVPPSTQQAYPNGVAWTIGAGTTTIEAENYDMLTSGVGEGETYHDIDTANKGNAYRTTEGVDIEAIPGASNGYDVGWAHPGEWLEYSINVNQGGNYKVIAVAGSGITNASTFHIEFGPHGATSTATPLVSVPNTGDWVTYTEVTVAESVTLTAGNQIMKLVLDSGTTDVGNFDCIKLIKLSAEDPNIVATPTISPGAGTFTGSVTVTLGCATSGAEIRYTTNGTDPTSSSTLYSAPFALTASATVKARAFKAAMTDSSVNSVAYTITGVSTQQAYPSGVAWSIGAGTTTIEAENYDMLTTGIGEGEAYHDTTVGQQDHANTYRTTENVDVEIVASASNGYDVGWVQPGEWLEYSINVNQGGNYKIIASAGCGVSNASPFHIEIGSLVTPSVSIPNTVDWQAFTDVTVADSVTLPSGNQIMKLVMDAGSTDTGNFDYIKLVRVSAETPNTVETPTITPGTGSYASYVTVTLGCATSGAEIRYTTNGTDPTSSSTLYSAPFTLTASATVRARAFKTAMTDSSINSAAYTVTSVSTQQSYGNSGNPWAIITGTSTIEAENYDWITTGGSGEGLAYHDMDATNRGGAYRTTEGVDVENVIIGNGGYDIGYVQPGEWLEYSINVNQGGDYKVIARAGCGISGATPFHIEFGPHNATNLVTPSVSVPNTVEWQAFTDVTVAESITLTAGNQIMKLVMDAGSTDVGNFDYIKLISLTTDTTPPSVSVVTPTNVTGSGVVITWTTNEPANSKVEYGLTTGYGSATPVTDADGVYSHSVTLSGLTQNTLYHYRMVSVDMNGNPTTTGDYSFTTTSNDPNPPVISNVVAGVTLNSAVIKWTTDENSDSQVAYGTTTAMGTITTLDPTSTRLHSVPISGLQKGKTYYYKVYSRDSSNNLATSAQYSFKTYNLKHRIYTYYYDDGTTTTKVGASAAASLKFKVQVYNVDENSIATDYTGTLTLTTKNSKSSVLDTTDSTLITADAGEKEVAIPFRSDINTIELTGDVTAPVVISFNDMYIAKLVGYQGGSIRGSNGLKILIPTGVLSANKYLASIKTSAAPAVQNSMKYVNTVNPICYDFGELTFNNNAPVLQNQVFTRAVNITIPYTAADIGTLNEDGLRIYYWTGTDWDLVSGVQTVDKVNNTITATVKHFSTYRILGSYVSADMSNVKIYPNPYNPATAVLGKLKIINLPMNSNMKLYNVTGELVRELKEIDFGNLGWIEWDGKDSDGDKVGRGIYIYQIEDAAGSKKSGKIGLIK
ncbi:MAG: carbohydrate-binding protein [Elusimicrobia bacterium]|nr:carbohydrate-binding protein [Elusimicrobiota bacterium]